jgi:hypothetical protein
MPDISTVQLELTSFLLFIVASLLFFVGLVWLAVKLVRRWIVEPRHL